MFEAEKMITKRGWYHKKCFACCKCKTQLDYFNCIEGPDDDVYCKVCYLRFWGPGQSVIRLVLRESRALCTSKLSVIYGVTQPKGPKVPSCVISGWNSHCGKPEPEIRYVQQPDPTDASIIDSIFSI